MAWHASNVLVCRSCRFHSEFDEVDASPSAHVARSADASMLHLSIYLLTDLPMSISADQAKEAQQAVLTQGRGGRSQKPRTELKTRALGT